MVDPLSPLRHPNQTMASKNDDALDRESALVDDLAERIRQRIMSGEFAIGAQLRQATLANEFNVSRTPVREALRQLQSGGLITVVPNRGAVVRVPSPWEVREAYEVRAELEALAAERAAARITPGDLAKLEAANETMRKGARRKSAPRPQPGKLATTTTANDTFHTVILDAAGNARLKAVVEQINQNFPRHVLAEVLVDSPDLRAVNVDEHDAIIAALKAGDGPAARNAMRKHVLNAGEHLARWYEERSTTVFRG
jgi:DNA-binding GntR family transcriptional regulator